MVPTHPERSLKDEGRGRGRSNSGRVLINADTTFHLRPDRVEISTPVQGTILDSRLNWVDHPDLREQVQDLVWDLAISRMHTWFASECGRCGLSCRRPILVREADLVPLAQKLGLPPERFRDEYLEPAATWNAGDGMMRLENGACPFLGEEAGLATCSVYDVRPQECRTFLSSAPFCRKEPSELLERLERVTLQGGTIRGKVRERPETPPEADGGLWERLRGLLEPRDVETKSRYGGTLVRTRELVQKMLDEYPSGGTAEDHRRRLESLRELVHRLAEMGTWRPEEAAPMEDLWVLFRQLEDRVHGRVAVQSEAPSEQVPAPSRRRLARLTLMEQGLSIHYRFPEGGGGEDELLFAFLPLAQFPTLAGETQSVLYHALTRADDDFQAALTEDDPPCFLCGECCGRVYVVEIKRTDVDRLAGHLGLGREEFEERYTDPARFSWNKARRVLKKAERPLHPLPMRRGPNQELPMPLPVLPTVKECVFLEHREDGFHYCSVHSHKPDVCRGYSSRNSLCRRTNQVANWGRQARSLLSLELGPEEIAATTWRDVRRGLPARTFARSAWPPLDRAAAALEAKVEELLEATARQVAGEPISPPLVG